jgi:tetratricopeptide (TPR) repeat protein
MSKLINNLTNSNRHILRGSTAFFASLLFFSISFAQGRAADTNTIAGNEEIHGTVKFPPGDVSGIRATVILRSMSSPEAKALTDRDGEFRFTHLRPDHYTVIIDAGDAYEKATETVSVGFSGSVPAQGNPFSYASPAVYEVRIYLRPKGSPNADQSALSGFHARISGSAKKLFRQALEEQRSGHHVKAIDNLKAVITEVPSFTAAYTVLATEYLKTGEGQLALDTLKKGVDIDPEDPTLRLDYGIALLNQKQSSAAETELRLSIQKSKVYSVAAHYYLGVALLTEHKTGEAQTILEDVVKNGGGKLPLVHRYLGGIYFQNKQYRSAADELEKYLKLEPKPADADKISEIITESRSKS